MDINTYVILIALAALVYSGIARWLQMKLVDQNAMKDMQAESKRLNEEMKKAKESDDKERVDKLMKEQMEMLPKMNKIMLQQFKPMIVIIVVFLIFNYAIGLFNPAVLDDIKIQLFDDGKGCDLIASDGKFSSCYNISGTKYGKWTVAAKAFSGKTELGTNMSFFMYNSKNAPNPYVTYPTGQPLGIELDKKEYLPGEMVKIVVNAPKDANNITATLDAGTTFYVDLPFAIPVLNVQRIYETNWWFIFVALIAGLVISFVMGRLQKAGMFKQG